MNYKELSYKHLSRLSEKIKQRIPDNTGEAAASLEVDGNKLLGNDYIYFLDQGRGPGKFPPVSNIAEWVKRKLGFDDKEAKQVAFLVGRKISNEGTEIYKYKSKGLQLDDLIDDTLNELTKELPEVAAVEVLKCL